MKTIEMSNYSVGESCYNEIGSVCEKYNVKKVIYGHLHGKESFEMGLKGIRNGIEYRLILLLQIQLYMVLNVQ